MTSPDVEVRGVAPDEWRAARDVRLAMLLDAPRAFGSTYARSAALTDDDWRARHGPDGHPSWLAWEGDRPVGAATLLRPALAGEDPHLVGMWVSASVRATGVGRLLVDTVLEQARALGATRVRLDVAIDNEAAVALYRAAGFVETGRTGVLPWDETVVEREMVRSVGRAGPVRGARRGAR